MRPPLSCKRARTRGLPIPPPNPPQPALAHAVRYEDIQREATMVLRPDCFEGMRFEINRWAAAASAPNDTHRHAHTHIEGCWLHAPRIDASSACSHCALCPN